MKITKYLISTAILALTLTSCKTSPKDEKIVPVQELYNQGLELLKEEDYSKAAEQFEKVFYQHPGHPITASSELMNAYALYKNEEYDESIDVIDIFIKLHPRNKDIAYAYYIKALAYYAQISDVKLDQSRTENALASLNEVIEKFPGSKYATDAELKIDLVQDHLAGKEMLVGRYYLNKNNPIAATKRFQYVVQDYSTTSHVPEALYRLVESNEMLGLRAEALKYHEVLKLNYPQSDWFKYSKKLID
ncbi:MAG: hypothetical protein DGJ47_000767 [Rickettsiaceae bacterium]